MPTIRKPLAEITTADLQLICTEKWLEDEQIDFKETIPHKDGEGRDPWRDDQEIKPYGRDQLLAAVVAFANSYGGDLVVGIKDSGDKPGRAKALQPLLNCADAADRLAQAANASIDPQIPSLQSRGVATDEAGAGVVILRVPRSRLAPHRLSTTRECYQRVRHETVVMSMRQIQELTFTVARRVDAVERRLADLRGSFQHWAQVDQVPTELKRACVRVVCVPADDSVYLEHVHNVEQVRPRQRKAFLKTRPDRKTHELHFPFNAYQWRPTLRGSEAEERDDERRGRLGVYCDGAITYELVLDVPVAQDVPANRGRSRTHVLYPGWVFAIIVNAVEAAQSFREFAGASAVDYAIEFEIVASHDLPIITLDTMWQSTAGTLHAGAQMYPRYVLGSAEARGDAYLLMWRDFWNSIGVDVSGDEFLLDPA